ncbi:MAG: hypothetical protein NZ740_04845 [Kiritimatiellae bacterium]|nr:hypothetical protein [Kiritimatiellia bacterium]MDW8458419.1 hypothetical protein [Verrucomicrobiota bacterium]
MNTGMSATEYSREQPRVTVSASSAAAVTQTDQVRICPLGLQVELDSPIELFTILETSIEYPHPTGEMGNLVCTGTVVGCRFDPRINRYRVWIQFLDLPHDIRERLHCVSKGHHLLCPYCENF